jgi:hypothetical protein
MQSCSCYYWTVVGEPVHILHIRRAELASKLFRSFGLQACCVLGRLLMVVQLCGCLSEEQSNRLTPKTLSFAPSAQISKQAPVPSILGPSEFQPQLPAMLWFDRTHWNLLHLRIPLHVLDPCVLICRGFALVMKPGTRSSPSQSQLQFIDGLRRPTEKPLMCHKGSAYY